MNDFLKKVVDGSGDSPSNICLQSFNQNFEDAVNVEWFKKKDRFEAVFYKNNIEIIAIFSLSGSLIEYRQNLTVDFLPMHIRNLIYPKGEIMNTVLRNKGNLLEYEIIFRDTLLNRYLLVVSDMGIVLKETKL